MQLPLNKMSRDFTQVAEAIKQITSDEQGLGVVMEAKSAEILPLLQSLQKESERIEAADCYGNEALKSLMKDEDVEAQEISAQILDFMKAGLQLAQAIQDKASADANGAKFKEFMNIFQGIMAQDGIDELLKVNQAEWLPVLQALDKEVDRIKGADCYESETLLLQE